MHCNSEPPWPKVGYILLGYLGAVIMHGLWNGSSLLGAQAYFLVYIFWMVPIFALAIGLGVASRRREQRVVADKLPGMVAHPAAQRTLQPLHRRRHPSHRPTLSAAPSKWTLSRHTATAPSTFGDVTSTIRMPPLGLYGQGRTDVDGVVTKVRPWLVADTVTRLAAVVDARKMKMFAVIDHSGEATNEGLELRDTKLVIFGSPTAGTRVMVAAPLAALDLPLEVLVWADGSTTKISYTAPRALAARYRLSDGLADRLAGIDARTDAVIKV